ncbi:MAG TPA: radical SAM protein [Lysobacter sp.]
MRTTDALPASGGVHGPVGNATLQIHPSLKCNLACAHCYSSSSPSASLSLDPELVCDAISDAASMGYSVLSVSGGEPLMYSGLESVLSHARSLGLRTTVTTNGFFTDHARFARLSDLVDVLAISLDGPPEVHNRIRGNPIAFTRLQHGLDAVRAAGLPFGFIHTLTRTDWQHLPWVAQFASDNGASLLQVHPIELAGRARIELPDSMADEEILARAYVICVAIASKYAGRFQVQADIVYRQDVHDNPGLFYAHEAPMTSPPEQLGLLVLEADGSIVPLSHGFNRRYRVCNIRDRSLRESWPLFRKSGLADLRRLCREVWTELSADDAPLLSNWHEVICARSHGAPTCQPH